jgi:hypothetical protein
MAEAIEFDVNVQQAVSLRFTTPKRYDGQYGERCMWSTTDGRIFYTPPVVADLVAEANIQTGEQFAIGKFTKGRGKAVEWRIQRLTTSAKTADGASDLTTPAPSVTTAASVVPIRHTALSRQADSADAAESQDSVSWFAHNTALMTGCLCAAIDALSNASRYAASKDLKLEFNEEDIRAMANTLYINAGKSTYAGMQA